MVDIPGIEQPVLQSLPQLQSRMTFLYLERCVLKRADGAIEVWTQEGVTHLPAACICAILLGPGTNITHQAVELIAEAGVTLIWTGEVGVRYYASGRPMTRSSAMLIRQAAMVSNTRMHLAIAKMMYQMRFPDEDVTSLTMQQLRGREGSRIRQVYRDCSKQWNVEWNGREYDKNDFAAGNDVNKALSAGHACLYGLAHAIIAALGCSPGLGFVHVGHENSFVYDIADLYKAEITIPAAFEIAASHPKDIGSETRRKVRDMLVEKHIAERMVKDIHTLFTCVMDDDLPLDEVQLWNGTSDLIKNGYNFAPPEDDRS